MSEQPHEWRVHNHGTESSNWKTCRERLIGECMIDAHKAALAAEREKVKTLVEALEVALIQLEEPTQPHNIENARKLLRTALAKEAKCV